MFHVNTLDALPDLTRTVVTIGNFDGVHLGHQALLGQVISRAQGIASPAVAVTFEPHPVRFFRGPDAACFRLTTPDQRARHLAGLGLDGLVVLDFDATLASMSPDEFIERIVVAGLHPAFVLVGYDFNFGRGRAGSPDDLRRAGPKHGFEADAFGPFELDGTPVSSSRIRRALRDGQVEFAQRLLGRPFALEGRVVRGDGRGRDLGFPTANLQTALQLVPGTGIYVTTLVDGDARLAAVSSVGTRPTFYEDGSKVVVETFVLDAAPTLDLYDRTVELEFHTRLRAEARFASVDELIEQMQRDVDEARRFHGAAP